MANNAAKLLAVALAGAGTYGLWTLGQSLLGDDQAEGTQHVVNQVWIERVPVGPRDMIGHLVLLDLSEGRLGGAGRSSQWRHFIELFQWGLEGHRLSVYFPQEQAKAQLKVRSWRCEGEAPEPFELCLEISNRRRSTTFYSMEDWVIDPDHADQSLAALAEEHPELAGMMDPVSPAMVIEPSEAEGWPEVDGLRGLSNR